MIPILCNRRGGGAAALAVSAAASSLAPTEGDTLTLTGTVAGASRVQWYRDGRYVLGGTSAVLTIPNVGVQDAGSYVLRATNETDTLSSNTLSIGVTANNILTDNFGSGVSAQWTTVNGTPSVSGGKLTISAGGSVTLVKAISDDHVRLKFKVDPTNFTAGQLYMFTLLGAAGHAICQGNIVESAGDKFLQFLANVDGWYSGGSDDFYTSAMIGSGLVQKKIVGETEVELRWDYANRNAFIYVAGNLLASIKGAVDNFGTFPVQPAVSFTVGNVNEAGAAGSVTVDAVEIKVGAVAANGFTARTKQAVIGIAGQSNAAGAAVGSYSAVTDDIDHFVKQGQGNPASGGHGTLSQDTPDNDSANIVYSFVQSESLPAGYSPFVVFGAVGSTGFSTDPGWDVGSLYRTRYLEMLRLALAGSEVATPFALLWHQGETDAGSATYAADLSLLIDDTRAITGTVGGQAVPWLSGGLSPAYLLGGEVYDPNYQTTTDDIESLMNSKTRCGFASSMLPTPATYQPSGGNRIHFDGAGYRTMGGRYATKYDTIVNRVSVP